MLRPTASSQHLVEKFFRSSGWIHLVLMELTDCRKIYLEKVERNFSFTLRISPCGNYFGILGKKSGKRNSLHNA